MVTEFTAILLDTDHGPVLYTTEQPREAWTCDHEPKCVTLAIHREQGPRRERVTAEASFSSAAPEPAPVVIEAFAMLDRLSGAVAEAMQGKDWERCGAVVDEVDQFLADHGFHPEDKRLRRERDPTMAKVVTVPVEIASPPDVQRRVAERVAEAVSPNACAIPPCFTDVGRQFKYVCAKHALEHLRATATPTPSAVHHENIHTDPGPVRAARSSSPVPKVWPTRPCSGCNGTGRHHIMPRVEDDESCDECAGTGEVDEMDPTEEEVAEMLDDKPTCRCDYPISQHYPAERHDAGCHYAQPSATPRSPEEIRAEYRDWVLRELRRLSRRIEQEEDTDWEENCMGVERAITTILETPFTRVAPGDASKGGT